MYIQYQLGGYAIWGACCIHSWHNQNLVELNRTCYLHLRIFYSLYVVCTNVVDVTWINTEVL